MKSYEIVFYFSLKHKFQGNMHVRRSLDTRLMLWPQPSAFCNICNVLLYATVALSLSKF